MACACDSLSTLPVEEKADITTICGQVGLQAKNAHWLGAL